MRVDRSVNHIALILGLRSRIEADTVLRERTERLKARLEEARSRVTRPNKYGGELMQSGTIVRSALHPDRFYEIERAHKNGNVVLVGKYKAAHTTVDALVESGYSIVDPETLSPQERAELDERRSKRLAEKLRTAQRLSSLVVRQEAEQ